MLIKCRDDVAEETYIRLLNNQSAVLDRGGNRLAVVTLNINRFLPFVIAYVLGLVTESMLS